ncbi:MAG TPA: hypothetical protein PLD25_21685 [Chloroflexota bacterium]|nr:hypothetical protein [Chloroflexota bacterium]
MNGKRFGIHFVVLLAVLIGFTLFLGVQAAGATPIRWARWWTNTSFPNDAMDTDLVIQLGYTTQNGQNVITQQQSFNVSCTAVGNPVILSGKATFDGSSYFSCALPNIRDLVYGMSNGTLWIGDSCAAKRPALTGILTIDGTPNNLAGDNPLFYREDIQFSLPLKVSTQEAKVVTAFDGVGAVSDGFAISAGNQAVTAVYVRTNPGVFAPTFTVDSLSLVSTPSTVNGPFWLTNLDTTIYIGYSPVSGKYFEGTLSSLLVDPVCVGTG